MHETVRQKIHYMACTMHVQCQKPQRLDATSTSTFCCWLRTAFQSVPFSNETERQVVGEPVFLWALGRIVNWWARAAGARRTRMWRRFAVTKIYFIITNCRCGGGVLL